MKRLCDVPDCQREGVEEVNGGWMCRKDAIAWDKANERGEVFDPAEFMLAAPGDDETLPANEGHSKWLGKRA